MEDLRKAQHFLEKYIELNTPETGDVIYNDPPIGDLNKVVL